jgi:hypothetical protein
VLSKADGMSKLIECLNGLFGANTPRVDSASSGQLISAVAEFTNPLFQNHLIVPLDPRKNNSHVTVCRSINHFADSREGAPFAGDFDSQIGSHGKEFTRGHAAAIQTQIGDPLLKLDLRLQIGQFDTDDTRVTASPSAFDLNLDRILDFVSHTFIFRNGSRDSKDISEIFLGGCRLFQSVCAGLAP